MRRADDHSESCRFAGWTVTVGSRELRKGRTQVTLEPKTLQVLLLILERAGEVATYEAFQKRIWPDVSVEVVTNVNVRVKQLRDVLTSEDPGHSHILTKRREGYQLNPEVTVIWDAPTSPPQPHREGAGHGVPEWFRRIFRQFRSRVAFAATAIGVVCASFWGYSSDSRPPADWRISGKRLIVVDAEGRVKWTHTFEHFPADLPREVKHPLPQVLISDLNGDGKAEVLFNYFPTEPSMGEVPDGGAELYCFSGRGAVLWKTKFGSAFTTPAGLPSAASRYQLLVMGRLKKPRPDGGLIVAGGHHAGGWAFEVALYTAQGKRVAEYLHPGWLYSMLIADIDGDGAEEILLGGINNGYGDRGYGATLVVLDSQRFGGQGSVPAGDDRQAVGRETGLEAAAIVMPEFAPTSDQHRYCRVESIAYAGGVVEVEVSKASDTLPKVFFSFDRRLRLIGVQPDLNFAARLLSALPSDATSTQRRRLFLERLGDVKYLRNRFDASLSAKQP